MVGKNSKKVNDKEKKRKKRKRNLQKIELEKLLEPCLNCLETKSESGTRRKEDVELNWISSIWRRMKDRKWDKNLQNIREFVDLKV